MAHERFHYKSLDEVQAKAQELGLHLPFAADTRALAAPLKVRNITLPNRLGVAPMEGADSLPDGSPSEYTVRRYVNEAVGGSAVIWFEAISIVEEGRSSQTQLLISRENLDAYKAMVEKVKKAGLDANGYEPYLILQANHSGRYSNPGNKPAPMIAYRHPELEQYRSADDSCIVTDDYLKSLEEKFGQCAALAKQAGFDAVDIKSCHGYLLAELNSAYNRPGPWPWGFGVSPDSGLTPDLEEPIRLVRLLRQEYGLDLMDLTMGNPYATTHVTRPFDKGKYQPDEHPFVGLDRMINGIGAVKKAVPDMTILASAPTYLRQYADLYAAGAVEEGLCDGMLFGRMAFADPDFANEIVKNGRIDPKRVCMTCGCCGDLIRAHKPTGCVVRDPDTFLPFYREFQQIQKTQPKNFRG